MNETNNQIMWIVCFFAMYIYNIFFYYNTSRILRMRMKLWMIIGIFPLVITMVGMYLVSRRVFLPVLNLIVMGVYILSFILAYREKIFNIYILCLNNIFHLIKLRGMTIAYVALFVNSTIYNVNRSDFYYVFSFITTNVSMILFCILFCKHFNIQKIKTMLMHKNALITVTITKTTLTVLMANMEYINDYLVNTISTIPLAIIGYVLINICSYSILVMTYKTIQWIEKEMVHEITEMQLEYQKQLYSKQNECEELLKLYKHDYKSILENSVRFIENGEPEEARRLLKQTDDHLSQILQHHSRNSNSLIVDVILNGLEEKCIQQGIEFSANCYIPENIHISELEFSKIFNNMANNAFEACMKQNADEYRWISFRSYVKDKKLVIYQKNSFNGEIRYEKQKLATTKVDRKLHGIGMSSIQYTVETLDGMFMFKTDQEKNIFEILIKIPLK